jgi:glycosyltransferase involved in cell wall biosynthesis
MANICIVSHFAYGAFSGGDSGHAGGVERQTTLMANWLTRQGHQVSLITWDEGQRDGCDLNGVTNFKVCKQSDGFPVLRFFTPRWTSLVKALQRADADLYYHNCAEYVTGQIALWCKHNRKKFIFSIASDPDCDPALPKLPSLREKILYKYGIRHADALIVQTKSQEEMIGNGFNLKSIIIPMPCPLPSGSQNPGSSSDKQRINRVIWVGRISKEKQLELMLDVAETLPEIQFSIAGKPKEEDDYVRSLKQRAATIENVEMLGMVPREKMDDLYRNASILCCTSHYEGFPNTFLEAWSHGVPVVSTVDPDGVIVRHGLGRVATSKVEISREIRSLLESEANYDAICQHSRDYFLNHHTLDSSMKKFQTVFRDVLEQ